MVSSIDRIISGYMADTPTKSLQASFEEHNRDTEIDAPMAHLSLQNLQVSSFGGAWGPVKAEQAVDIQLMLHMAHILYLTPYFPSS